MDEKEKNNERWKFMAREPIGVRYYKITSSEKYLAWQTEILSKIYTDFSFLKMGDKTYPVVCFEPSKERDFVSRVSTDYDLLTEMDAMDINKPICRNFGEIVEPHMMYKEELAYMIHTLSINDQNKLDWFSTKVSNYQQTMYTSNILEYELYKYYRETRGIVPDLSGTEILEHLPLRKAIHGNRTQFYVVTHGEKRNAGVSIQLFYTFYDKDKRAYMTPFAQLPNNVAMKQGRYQLLPEAGYRLRNKRLADNEGLFANYKLNIACNRILLEQIYGHEEVKDRDKLLVNPNEDPVLRRINKNLVNKEAVFDMLGVTIDLVTLRPTLSFILRIDEHDYPYRSGISSNNLEMKVETMKVDELEKFLMDTRVTNESMGMYYLLNQHDAYHNIRKIEETVGYR